MKARCGWAKPVLRGSVTHCATCHGTLRFDLHINQWVHESEKSR